MTNNSPDSRKFAVALSFSGEHRAYVKEVADTLVGLKEGFENHFEKHFGKRFEKHFEKGQIFYDYYFEGPNAIPKLKERLSDYYRTGSELLVVFLCPGYYDKTWCKIEWTEIKKVIDEDKDYDRVFLLCLGEKCAFTKYDESRKSVFANLGLNVEEDGFYWIAEHSSTEIALEIFNRYNSLREKAENEKEKAKNEKRSKYFELISKFLKLYTKKEEYIIVSTIRGYINNPEATKKKLPAYEAAFESFEDSVEKWDMKVVHDEFFKAQCQIWIFAIQNADEQRATKKADEPVPSPSAERSQSAKLSNVKDQFGETLSGATSAKTKELTEAEKIDLEKVDLEKVDPRLFIQLLKQSLRQSSLENA